MYINFLILAQITIEFDSSNALVFLTYHFVYRESLEINDWDLPRIMSRSHYLQI